MFTYLELKMNSLFERLTVNCAVAKQASVLRQRWLQRDCRAQMLDIVCGLFVSAALLVSTHDNRHAIVEHRAFSRQSVRSPFGHPVGPVVSCSASQPVSLCWNNLNVYAKDSKGNRGKQILHGVTGAVLPGQLVALMGASGAGKSTLINTLVQRNISQLVTSGDVYVNGQSIGRDITAIAGYVQQDDLFSGALTVREHMMFQAMLRLPASMSYQDKMQRVDEVIHDLGLSKCRDTKIGIPGVIKGISGGEKKRLSFASEILRDPSLLFCDEPTTGLDSFMAESVVTIMQQLAASGKTIVCTIHQPASEIYAMFDRVLFLAEGRTAFFGSAAQALQFFAGLGYRCPTVYNPADYIVEVLAVNSSEPTASRERVQRICQSYEQSDSAAEMHALVQHTQNQRHVLTGRSKCEQRGGATRLTQFAALFCRAAVFNFRNPSIALAKYVQRVLFGLFVGLLYLNTVINQSGIQNINGALYYIVTQNVYPVVFAVIFVIPSEYQMLNREHHDGLYSVGMYYLARTLAHIPVYGVDGVLMISIAYFMIGLVPAASVFFTCVLVGFVIEQVGIALGTMLSAVTPSFAVAVTIGGPLLALCGLTGGLFANVGTLPAYIAWLTYISPFRYGFEALAVAQWTGVESMPCDAPSQTDAAAAALLTNASQPAADCVITGKQVLQSLAFPTSYAAVWTDIGCLLAIAFVLHIVGYIGLFIRVYRSR